MNQNNYIYALLDGSNHIFYIGRSRNINKRLSEHLDESRAGGKSKKCQHIRDLLDQGETITIKQVDEGPADKIEELEAWWIDKLWMTQHADGYIIDLKNGNAGSQGNVINEAELRNDIQQWKKQPKPKRVVIDIPYPPGPHDDKTYEWWESHPEEVVIENARRAAFDVTRKYLLNERKKDEKRFKKRKAAETVA